VRDETENRRPRRAGQLLFEPLNEMTLLSPQVTESCRALPTESYLDAGSSADSKIVECDERDVGGPEIPIRDKIEALHLMGHFSRLRLRMSLGGYIRPIKLQHDGRLE